MIVTLENIFEVHEKVLESVYENDYYVGNLEYILDDSNIETAKDVILFWQRFWERLPDSGSIRRHPFYDICDIAENVFNPVFFDE